MPDLPNGERTNIDQLRQRRAHLLRMKAQLGSMLGDLDALIAAEDQRTGSRADAPANDSTAALEKLADSGPTSRGRPVRVVVLDALEEVGWATYSRELSQFCSAWMGKSLPAERFGSLGSDELKAYQRSLESGKVRPVWLCFALTHDRHQPIKRLWCRSDWPLENRIIAPSSGRVQHLKLTAALCELAGRDGFAENADMMRIIAADHARDLPGVRIQRGKFDLAAWRSIALDLLAELEPRDAETRLASAERLRERGPFIQLFGVPEAEEIDDIIPLHQRRRG